MTWETPHQHAAGLVDAFLDKRLKDANEPPGLREAVIDQVQDRVDEIRKRGGNQIGSLRSSWSRRMPDAYLADEEVLENELQTGAAGIRTARAVEGLLTEDPRGFEHELGRCLAPTARWAMRAEASRVPRPATRPEALEWSLTPIPWVEDDSQWPPAAAVALDGARQLVGGGAEPVRVAERPYVGWVQLGFFERQGTLARRYPDVPARRVLICAGLEICDRVPAADSMPLAGAPPNAWSTTYDHLMPGLDPEGANTELRTTQGPFAAVIDYDLQLGAPHRLRGAGLHPFALVPRLEVIALLGLRPERLPLRHVLVDDQGPAVVGRLWRGFLIHDGNYTPLVPGVEGADLIIRPDLYDRLEAAVGKDRISLGCTISLSERARSSDHMEPEG
jgi:hypothetical protein